MSRSNIERNTPGCSRTARRSVASMSKTGRAFSLCASLGAIGALCWSCGGSRFSTEPGSDAGRENASDAGRGSGGRAGGGRSGGAIKSEAGEGGQPDAGASGELGGAPSGGRASGGTGGARGGTGGAQGGRSTIGGIGGIGIGGIGAGGPPVTNGLALWLNTDRGITEADGTVSKWADQSGHGRDAIQTTASERPKQVSVSGSRTMIEFDGADDALSVADGFDDFAAGVSFFAVVEALGMPTCSSLLQLSNGSEMDDVDFALVGYSLAYEVSQSYFAGPEAYQLTQRIIAGVIHRTASDGSAELRVDGEYLRAEHVETPVVKARYDNFIGRSLYDICSPLQARIGEILLYSRALEQSERVEVEEYLRSRWQ